VSGEYPYDALIISVGGKSSPKLGSTGDFHNVLLKHGYSFKECHPSLCPIKTKENTKMVEGLRSKVSASLYQGNKLIHEEEGELLFKKDGLSGMVIFNLTHYINQLDNKNNVTIHIDFAKGLSGEYDSLTNPKIAQYLFNNKLDIHNTIFTFKDFYGYDNSQVTSGGLKISELNLDLSSKKEKGVYFIGEVVDVDAICGGYNIMWALASAEKVNKAI
ncbi:MAG: NAD(P)/FAD-dependent oxidoreductase, partial [Bacilli bacterium]|nr:NAD(P)/FAD-dependent oxidoreductase [Bacilli bacterium]